MFQKLKQQLEKSQLFQENQPILVAVSGGPDSVALLDLLFKLRKELGCKLVVAHFNHGLRGKDSDSDQQLVEKLASGYGLEVEIGQAEKKIISEEQARKVRYGFLVEVAKEKGIKQICLAHTKDDLAETIIFNFIRGAGAKGLVGIRPKNTIIRGGEKYLLVRPLLGFAKKELLSYLKENKLDFRVDKTNLETDFTRNKIRLELIPQLLKYNSNLVSSLANRSKLFASIDGYLSQQADNFMKKADVLKNKVELDQTRYLALPLALRLEVIRLTCSHLKSLKNITADNLFSVEEIFNQTSRDSKEKSFKGLIFQKRNGKLLITIENK